MQLQDQLPAAAILLQQNKYHQFFMGVCVDLRANQPLLHKEFKHM